MGNYLPSENANISRLSFFIIVSFMELILLGIGVKIDNDKSEYLNVINIFLSIVGGVVFLTDGILGNNIIQVKNYLRILGYSLLLIILAFKKANSEANVIYVMCLGLIILELIIIWALYKSLKLEYKWYHYKKHGLSENLQYAREIGQRLMVYYKIDVIVTLTSALNPRNRETSLSWMNINLTVLIISTYLYLGWKDTESYINRVLIVILYFIKMISDLIAVTEYFAPKNNFNIMNPIRLIYVLVNDALFFVTLIIEITLFDRGYYEKLYRNIQEEKIALE